MIIVILSKVAKHVYSHSQRMYLKTYDTDLTCFCAFFDWLRVFFKWKCLWEKTHFIYCRSFVWRILLLLPWHFSFSYLFAECKAKAKHYFDSYLLTYVKALWERTNDSKQLDKQFWARHLVNNKTLSFFNKQNCYKYNNQNKFHFWRVDTSCSM
jgi:hypothetical protein